MSGPRRRQSLRRLLLGLLAIALLAGALAATLVAAPASLRGARAAASPAARPAPRSGSRRAQVAASAGNACGTASAATIAAVDAVAARGIYQAELNAPEVTADRGHVTSSRALVQALASNNKAAVYAAVHALVYAPGWHIVRLRVLSTAGQVLADVGGPYVIAPVTGALTLHGRTVGSYVMSVQDDVGFVKLVTRFIGVPIDLYRGGSFLMGTLQPAPRAVAAGRLLHVAGRPFTASVLSAKAFPEGTLSAALLVATPSAALAAESCEAVRASAWRSVAMHIAARLAPIASHYQDLVDLLHGTTGGLVYVREGAHGLAGGASPAHLPRSGTVTFGGRSWSVISWEPVAPARIYFLAPSE